MRVIRTLLLAGIAIYSIAQGFGSAHALEIVGSGLDSDAPVASGTTLWSLVDNAVTSTPAGYNSKNSLFREYVVATGANGQRSVFSLGELSPSFGGTNAAPYVTVTGGVYSLVDPNAGASGRDVSNLTSLTVLSVPAAPAGTASATSSITLSGLSKNSGTYTASTLASNFTATSEVVGGDTYTGIQLFSFLNPSSSNITSQIVTIQADDGYVVVLSLAELDPALGGSLSNLLVYADSGTDLPANGLARDLLPSDNKHGRWVSDMTSISVMVAAVPEPSTWAMMLVGFAGLGFAAFRRTKRIEGAPMA